MAAREAKRLTVNDWSARRRVRSAHPISFAKRKMCLDAVLMTVVKATRAAPVLPHLPHLCGLRIDMKRACPDYTGSSDGSWCVREQLAKRHLGYARAARESGRPLLVLEDDACVRNATGVALVLARLLRTDPASYDFLQVGGFGSKRIAGLWVAERCDYHLHAVVYSPANRLNTTRACRGCHIDEVWREERRRCLRTPPHIVQCGSIRHMEEELS